jgi:small-conductance mechanosensitive channel
MDLANLTELSFLGNRANAWLTAIGAFVLTAVGVSLALRWLTGRLRRLAERSDTTVDDTLVDVMSHTQWWVLVAVGLYTGSGFLELPEGGRQAIGHIAGIALIVQAGIWAHSLVGSYLARTRQKRLARAPASVTTLNALGFVGRIAIWSLVLLVGLDNLGIDVTALVAGLGVGGVAVALAVQNILGDLFASLSIVFDKPFMVGDFLIIDSYMGSVEYVGLKTTRLRSQLVFSNSDLLGSRIRNYGRMYERRVAFDLGVTYETPREKVKMIPEILREAIESQPQTRFDRSHFKAYGESALLFETVYYVGVPDYTVYMDIQQAVNLRIHERFEQEGIEFAYPTRTLFIRSQA